MKEYLQEIDWEQVITSNIIDECWESFKAHLTEARGKFVWQNTHNKNKRKKPLWMTAEVKARVRRRQLNMEDT